MLLPNLVFGQGTKTCLKTSVGLLITTADQDSPPHHRGVSTYSNTDSVVSFNLFFLFASSLSLCPVLQFHLQMLVRHHSSGLQVWLVPRPRRPTARFQTSRVFSGNPFVIVPNTSVLPLLLWLLPLCCTIHPPQLCQ